MINYKKIITSLLLISFPGIQASSGWFDDMCHTWGVGVRLATAATTGQAQNTTTLNGTTIATQCARFGGNSFQGGVFGEYAWRNDCWSVGFLADANWDSFNKVLFSATNTAASIHNEIKFKTPLHFGADFRFGWFVLDNCLWYSLVGVEGVKNDFTISNLASVTSGGIVPGCHENNFLSANIRAGSGLEIKLCDCFVMKFEYRFVKNGEKCVTLTDPVTNTTLNSTIKSNQQSFGWMLEYLF